MVLGGDDTGGLVGYNTGTVSECYSTSEVSGGLSTGGLVGLSPGRMTDCYCTGAVSGSQFVGGLVGADVWGGVVRCFWDTQASGLAKSAGGTGLTTAQMQDVQTYLDAGWDFVGETRNGTHQVWQMPQGGGYPTLAILNGFTPASLQGLGTPEDPYLISSALDLGAMVYYSPLAHYRLVAPIDLAGICWDGAVVPRFGGTFNGSRLTIAHLTIRGSDYLGLFGQLASGAEVRDLGIADANIAGSGDFVGPLAGSSEGTVTQCGSEGTVRGGDFVGGLVGENDYGQVTRCFGSGAVYGTASVGGLVGISRGRVTQCYSTSEVLGAGLNAAGLVGWNSGVVAECYSTGAVTGGPWNHGGLVVANDTHSVSGSFWDTQTSGQAHSDGGTGKTTAQMQTAGTFLDEGWDFNDVWTICEGKDYPRLMWEQRNCGE